MSLFMPFTAYKVTYTRNKYGDYTATGSTGESCNFRQINDLITASNNETIQSDAMAWFSASSTVAIGDVYMIEGEHYRVETLNRATARLYTRTPAFIKCYLLKYGVIS